MNDKLQQFARQEIKNGLSKLTPDNHRIFKLMYVPWIKNPKSSRKFEITKEECEAMPIYEVVDKMPAEKLDCAMQQVENSVKKLAKTTISNLEIIEEIS